MYAERKGHGRMYDIGKTLFVSDLDGTLLAPDGRLSAYTLETLDRLVAGGVRLAFATARSYVTAMKVVGDAPGGLPMILHNGAFIQKKDGSFVLKNLFGREDAEYLRGVIDRYGIPAIVYTLDGADEYFSYLPDRITPEERAFIDSRGIDPRNRPAASDDELWSGDAFYIACIGDAGRLSAAAAEISARHGVTVLNHPDYYTGDMWLELLPEGASKASAMKKLAELLGCERTVVFGDAENDLDMFRAADERYAVANAVPEVVSAADGVIGANGEDGVARFLRGALGI